MLYTAVLGVGATRNEANSAMAPSYSAIFCHGRLFIQCPVLSLSHQKYPYSANIFKKLDGPCQIYKRLEDYTEEEVARFPEIVKVPHL